MSDGTPEHAPQSLAGWLRVLEARLAQLEGEGQRFLTLPSDAALAAGLRDWLARQVPAPLATPAAAPPAPLPTPLRDASAPSALGAQPTASPTAQPASPAADAPPTGAPPRDEGGSPGDWRARLGVPEGPAPTPRPASPTAGSGTPVATGAAGLDQIATMESLQVRFRDCQACKLGSTRQRLVFGAGSRSPALMFIGEGPGADEDASGLPFVGRAGAVLTALILALGLTREDVYITNAVKCRPPGNRNPEPDELAACRPILERQMQLLNPRLIVTLGNVPLKLLKPNAAGITRERGQLFDYGGRPVLPTFHPSYLLHNPAGIGPCWADFRAAMQHLHAGF